MQRCCRRRLNALHREFLTHILVDLVSLASFLSDIETIRHRIIRIFIVCLQNALLNMEKMKEKTQDAPKLGNWLHMA